MVKTEYTYTGELYKDQINSVKDTMGNIPIAYNGLLIQAHKGSGCCRVLELRFYVFLSYLNNK